VLLALYTQHNNKILGISSQQCIANPQFVAGNYLKATGTSFTYMGQPVCLYGATMYTSSGPDAPGLSTNWHDSVNFPKRIDYVIARAKAAHLNIIRPTDQANSGNIYDPNIWMNMKYLVQQARKNNMFVLLDLSVFANNLKSQNFNPYDPAQAAAWNSFINTIVPQFKDEPNIAVVSLEGEVHPINSTSWPSSTAQGYLDFYRRVTDATYTADGGHHLIAAGGLSFLNDTKYPPWSGIPWQNIFSLPHVNIVSIHVYPSSPTTPNNSGDLLITVPVVGAWAKAQNKPSMIEEYGFIAGLGDTTRAVYMKKVVDAAIANGYTGIVLWNLGPEYTTGAHYDVNPLYSAAWAQLIASANQLFGTSTTTPINIPTPSVMPTIQAGQTQISLTVYKHGIGNSGDNSNASNGSLSNKNPIHQQITVDVQIFTLNNKQIAGGSGTITYNSTKGGYTGSLPVQSGFPSGQYIIKLKTNGHLRGQVNGAQTLTAGKDNPITPIALIAGDINNDNAINILDYNILMGCYSDLAPAISCTSDQKTASDLNDDGSVNQYDYNLFIRELSNQNGA